MNSSTVETQIPSATGASVNDEVLSVDLTDGRTISVPVAWYPRLSHATPDERDDWKLIGSGRGIHWLAREKVFYTDILIKFVGRESNLVQTLV